MTEERNILRLIPLGILHDNDTTKNTASVLFTSQRELLESDIMIWLVDR